MQQLSSLPGVMTPGEYGLIQRALKIPDRHLHEPDMAFTSTYAAREWLILNVAGLERGGLRVLYLNNQNQLTADETLFTDTINHTEVYPREVVKYALYYNVAAVVLAHNHPSGEATSSKADRPITERPVQTLALADIRVSNHLIVGGNQIFSSAKHGLLQPVTTTSHPFSLLSSAFRGIPLRKSLPVVKPYVLTNSILHSAFFCSVPANTAGTVARVRAPVVKCRIFPMRQPCSLNAVRTVLVRVSA